MNQLDTYYRALRDYRKETNANRDCESACQVFSRASAGGDRISVKRNICRIEEDWVEAIEKGLVCIEKALKEERQFIQSNGEVTPIEKVRHVSKESVVHLAQHSNLITREQTGDDIIPDSLFTVERLNDYTVYENRFLYMLLCYLQDFVSLRYTNILSLTNRYEGTLEIDRTSFSKGRTLEYKVTLHEINEDDSYLREHNPCRSMLDRIDLILKAIISFLSNPIMECCAKVAMIRPPITKTNVLKMNNNFKGAVRLYEYIVAYKKDGYTVEQKETDISPFNDELNAGLSEAGLLSSFLMYAHGMGIVPELKRECEEEDVRRLHAELAQRNEQLERLRRRLAKSEIDPMEYILELEKQKNLLEKEADKVLPLRDKIRKLDNMVEGLKQDVVRLRGQIECLNRELEASIRQYEDKLQMMEEEFHRQLEAQRQDFDQKVNDLNAQHEGQIRELQAQHETQLREITEQHEADLQTLRAEALAERQALEEQQEARNRETAAVIADLTVKLEELNDRCNRVSEDYRNEEQKRLRTEALLLAVRKQQGLIGEDESYTSEQEFDELEKQYQAFRRFYEENWRAAKKKIRKSLLTIENFRKKKTDTDASAHVSGNLPEDADPEKRAGDMNGHEE